MKFLILIVINMLFTFNAFSQRPTAQAMDSWLKIECRGPLVPRHPLHVRPTSHILTYYFQINPNEKIPKYSELFQADYDYFTNISHTCTNMVRALTDKTAPNGNNWPSWSNDWNYTKLMLSTVSFYDRSCRQKNAPCISSSHCCPQSGLTCDPSTRSCQARPSSVPGGPSRQQSQGE